MQIALDAPSRPALRYYGGKWNLAPWIISFFPPHLNYVEPCGGAASVLLRKPRSPLETYNDLDGNVVNFFRVLRDNPDELIRRIRLTPWARAEYELSLQLCGDDTERARQFFVTMWMSIGQAPTCTEGQFRSVANPYGILEIGMRLQSDSLTKVTERLLGVQIENKTYDYILNRYDNVDALIYFDPPYVTDTRIQGKVYQFEWTDEDHEIAARHLYECQGYVIISGYACPLYTDLYERHGWQRHDKEAQTNSGGKRIESVWLSPRTAEAIARPQQQGLFAQ